VDVDGLQVSLCNPHNGWLEVSISTEEEEFKEAVSYTPNDFTAELVMAAALLMQGQDGLAVASCEPNTYDFRFCKESDVGMGRFYIVGFPDHRRKDTGGVILSFRASTTNIALPFWRALRNLESRVSATDYQDAMRREFPSSQLQRLSALLHKG
jgi:hypothetical protein